jgi:hypothetical protein
MVELIRKYWVCITIVLAMREQKNKTKKIMGLDILPLNELVRVIAPHVHIRDLAL